jgi:hypothetical protein
VTAGQATEQDDADVAIGKVCIGDQSVAASAIRAVCFGMMQSDENASKGKRRECRSIS